MKSLIAAFLLFMPCLLSAASTVYVTDNLEISLRSGQSTRNKILKMLPSGTPLTVLEQNADSGYSRVRTSGGIEGWILTRFLSNTPSARTQLDGAKQALEQLRQENRLISNELTQLKQNHQQNTTTSVELATEKERLLKELTSIRSTAANAMQIQRQRDQLQERVVNLERESQQLKREKQTLEDSTAQDWFLIGAGVIVAGILLGLIIPKLSWRRKPNSWDSF